MCPILPRHRVSSMVAETRPDCHSNPVPARHHSVTVSFAAGRTMQCHRRLRYRNQIRIRAMISFCQNHKKKWIMGSIVDGSVFRPPRGCQGTHTASEPRHVQTGHVPCHVRHLCTHTGTHRAIGGRKALECRIVPHQGGY